MKLNKGGGNMFPDAETFWLLIDRWSQDIVAGPLTYECSDDDLLASWVVQILTGERLLSDASMELIDKHLQDCRICQSRLGAIEQPRLGNQATSNQIYQKIFDYLEKYAGQTMRVLKDIDFLRFGPQTVGR